MKRTTLSVKQMHKLLETQQNRTLTDRWHPLHRQMASGEWNPDVAPIIVFDDGTLADGQHRIRAAIEMGKPFTCWVVTIPKSDITKVDAGRSRTTRDHCRILGLPIQCVHSAAARFILWLRDNEWGNRRQYSHAEIIDAATQFRVVELPNPAREIRGASAFLAVWGYARSKCPTEADEFFTSVNTGESLRSGTAAFTLRKRLLNAVQLTGSSQQMAYLWMNVRAWNAHVAGEPITRLVLPDRMTPIQPNLGEETK